MDKNINYRVKKEDKKNPHNSTIESTITEAKHEFTMAQVKEQYDKEKQNKVEIEATKRISKAKVDNVTRNHKIVKELTEQQRIAVHMYVEELSLVKGYTETLNQINKNITHYEGVIAQIKKETGIEL